MEQQARRTEQASAAAVEQYKRELLEQARRSGAVQQQVRAQPAPVVHTAQSTYARQQQQRQQQQTFGQRVERFEESAGRAIAKAEPLIERAEPIAEMALRSGLVPAGMAAAAKGIELGMEAIEEHMERKRETRQAPQPVRPQAQPQPAPAPVIITKQQPAPAPTIINNNIEVDPNFSPNFAPRFNDNAAPQITNSPRFSDTVSPRISDTASPRNTNTASPRFNDTVSPRITSVNVAAAPEYQYAVQQQPQRLQPQPITTLPQPQPITAWQGPPDEFITYAPQQPKPLPVLSDEYIYEAQVPIYQYPQYPAAPASCLRPSPRACPVHGYRHIKKPQPCRCQTACTILPTPITPTAPPIAPAPIPITPTVPPIAPAPIPITPTVPPITPTPIPITPTVPPKQPRAVYDERDAWFLQPAVGSNTTESYAAPLPAEAAVYAAESAAVESISEIDAAPAYRAPEATTVSASVPAPVDYGNALAKVSYEEEGTVRPAYSAAPLPGASGTWELPAPSYTSLEDFSSKNTAFGMLTINVLTSDLGAPLPKANVRVTKTINDVVYQFYDVYTDGSGSTGQLLLPAPAKQLSFTPPTADTPYALYDIVVNADDDAPQNLDNVTVFADTESVQVVRIGKVRETWIDEAQYTA